jgi:hypothetical protein
MKKILLLAALVVCSFNVMAQTSPCVPDASYQDEDFGLWPDTIENLPLADVDVYYETHVQIKTPEEVGEVMGYPYMTDPGLGFEIDVADFVIDSIKLMEVVNVPEGMSVYFSEEDSVYLGNSVGCVTLFGTPTTPMIGQHDLVFLVEGWVGLGGNIISLYETTGEYSAITGYDFIVQDPNAQDPTWDCVGDACIDPADGSGAYSSLDLCEASCVSGVESLDMNRFSVAQNAPNPFTGKTTISYTVLNGSEVAFAVYNVLGELVKEVHYSASQGVNTIELDARELNTGIYFYTLSNGKETISKRMVVAGN